MPKMKGANIFVKALEDEGVEHIFGYPGGSVLDLYDALYDAKVKHFLVRHEQAAAHAADGYARTSDKVGVCLATSGPGATNLVTGLATAHMDSIPMVAFTGQVPTSGLGKDTFQEADMFGITMPITKHNFLVKHASELARTIKEAFHIASTGRPGPVVVDIPRDVTLQECEYAPIEDCQIHSYNPFTAHSTKQIHAALDLIKESKKPVIMAGAGIIHSKAWDELQEMAELLHIPVTCTLLGLGVFPCNHPLSLKMPGMHGSAYANYALSEADLIIGIGMRFDDRVTGKLAGFAAKANVIHIDIDPVEIGKRVPVTVPVVGDAKAVMRELLNLVRIDGGDFISNKSEWMLRIRELKQHFPLTYVHSDQVIKPQYVMERVSAMMGDSALITTDVGKHQMWAAQFIEYTRPKILATSGGLGTMGYGLPAAIGAQVANPDKRVVCLAGDGSIQMNIQELSTIAFYKLPVKIFIFNNENLGMVRQWQQLFFNERYSHSIMEGMQPDFVKLAAAYDILGLRCEKPSEVNKTIEQAFNYDGPVLVDFRIDRHENVYPMVPVGHHLNEMIFLNSNEGGK